MLGIEVDGHELHWAVADTHDIRGTGTENARVTRHAILRLIRREKPTAIATGPTLAGIVRPSAARFGLPTVTLPERAIPPSSLALLYQGVEIVAPSRPALRLLGRVVRAVLEVSIPPRKYAPTIPRHPTRRRGRA